MSNIMWTFMNTIGISLLPIHHSDYLELAVWNEFASPLGWLNSSILYSLFVNILRNILFTTGTALVPWCFHILFKGWTFLFSGLCIFQLLYMPMHRIKSVKNKIFFLSISFKCSRINLQIIEKKSTSNLC